MKYTTMYIVMEMANELRNITPTFGDKLLKSTTLTIPRTYHGSKTIGVDFSNSAIFKDEKLVERIEKIRIPNTVRTIRSDCFSGFTNLKEIEFYGLNSYNKEESELKNIGTAAFRGLSKFTKFPFEKCPELQGISYLAFEECNLTEVDLSKTKMLIVDSHSFEGNRIKTVKFPSTLREVGIYAFNGNCIGELDFSMCNSGLVLNTHCFACNMLCKVAYPLFGGDISPDVFYDNRFTIIEKENDMFV